MAQIISALEDQAIVQLMVNEIASSTWVFSATLFFLVKFDCVNAD